MVIRSNQELRKELFDYFRAGPLGGHSGVHATRHRIFNLFIEFLTCCTGKAYLKMSRFGPMSA